MFSYLKIHSKKNSRIVALNKFLDIKFSANFFEKVNKLSNHAQLNFL